MHNKGACEQMYHAMKYCDGTPNCGLFLKPNAEWDGSPDFEFIVTGRADSDHAKDPEQS